jgi:hypothetical protein
MECSIHGNKYKSLYLRQFVLTHEKKLEDVAKPLSILFYSLEPLIEKILTLLIQLPPFLSEKKGFTSLQDMVHHLDKRFRYSLEVRHSSWFNDSIYDFLKENDLSLVWSVIRTFLYRVVANVNSNGITFFTHSSVADKCKTVGGTVEGEISLFSTLSFWLLENDRSFFCKSRSSSLSFLNLSIKVCD